MNAFFAPTTCVGQIAHVGQTFAFGLAEHRIGDYQSDTVYLNLAGPPTSVEAVWASLTQGRTVVMTSTESVRPRTLKHHRAGKKDGAPYLRFQQRIPGLAIDHLILLDRRFVEVDYTLDVSDTFLFEGPHLAEQLMDHVRQLVDVAVFPQWAERLAVAGREDHLVRKLDCLGQTVSDRVPRHASPDALANPDQRRTESREAAMARLASIEKGGYYPFDPQHLPAVASLFQPHPEGGRILDPCAGEGAVLEALAEALDLTPYANELDDERASACRKRFGVTQTVQGDLLRLRTPHNAFVLNWVNPPYTANRGGASEKRRELEFLKHAWRWTQVDGYTVWVVYAHHVTGRAVRFLLENADTVDVYRVPGKHLDAYAQVVGVSRKCEKRDVTLEAVERLVAVCQSPDDLPPLELADEPRYSLPRPARPQRWYFHPDKITPNVMLPALLEYGAHKRADFQALFEAPLPPAQLAPIVPPRGGQIAQVLVAGLFDGLLLDLDQTQAAVRGVVRMVEVETTPEGMQGVKETYETRPRVTITLLFKDGSVKTIDAEDEAALVSFLKEHRSAFLQYLEEHSTPVYNFDYRPLDETFAGVFKNRRLPGRPVTGLFETQKHVAAATYAALHLNGRKGVIVVGEMGVGKSAIGAAVVGAMHKKGDLRPGEVAVVMCPPHLVKKWVCEAKDAIPGCHAEIVSTVDDVTAFMDRAEQRPEVLHVMVLSREKAKLGEGWSPAIFVKQQHFAQWPQGSPPLPRMNGQPRVVTRKWLCCPTCGEMVTSNKEGKRPASMAWLKAQPRKCNACGGALWQLTRRWSGPKDGEKFPRRNPRYPLATFLRQRYRDRLGVVMIDELHEMKGGGTDQGRAIQELVLSARKAIGLTGTLFGGVASSVFWLEWAFNPRMVEHYPIHSGRGPALARWTRTMGVLERVVEYKQDDGRSGAYTTTRRVEHRPREAPGISPRLVAEVLDHCIWVGLKDLNFALPAYVEVPVEVGLPGDAQAVYDRARDEMIAYHMARLEEGDATFLSTYFQAVLRYPSSCFRPKPVFHKLKGETDEEGNPVRRLVTTMKGFGGGRLYPKEEALLELLRDELEQGRRCAVFVAQTGTLDIQGRLAELIEEHVPGARPVVLRQSTTATDRRDAYLEKQVKAGCNMLITNPRLVQTGLDLLDFASLIFYEVDNSLYVTSQASRRHWRIGQTAECRVYYLYYADTMEARAVSLISRKQAAAALLGGDADGGGLAQLSGGANTLMAELTKTIAHDEALVDATHLFRQKAEVSLDFTSGWAAGIANGKVEELKPEHSPNGRARPEPVHLSPPHLPRQVELVQLPLFA
jgi:hypothetical protein